MRVQHNRIQHRVFLWVYMNIHITQHKCLRSFASHRRSPQTRDPVEVHWLTLYTWYVESTQEFHTQVQYMCNSEVSISKSCLYWPSVLYPAPCHPPFAPSFGGAQRLGTPKNPLPATLPFDRVYRRVWDLSPSQTLFEEVPLALSAFLSDECLIRETDFRTF